MVNERSFEIGDTVRLRWGKRTAKIEVSYVDIKGGVKLDKKLGGFFSWNINDLVKVNKHERRSSRQPVR